jgi:hypothetical protein
MEMTSCPSPLFVPADAGTQHLPKVQDVRSIKGWIPASAGMSGVCRIAHE